MQAIDIFNHEKTDYDSPTLFLGQPNGMLDTTHRHHERLWELWSNLRALDWDTNEFDFNPCLLEFKTKDKAVAQALIQTIGWQWEGDSTAANSIMAVQGNFVTNSALKTVWDQIVANENLHATTYSEIVRYSFDSSNEVLTQILSVKQSLQRMQVVAETMSRCKRISLEYAMGMRTADDPDVYAAAFIFTCALFFLERVHFMGSFAETGAIALTGDYMPICKAVQRIAQDEVEVHVNVDKYVIENELATARGRACWKANRKLIDDLAMDCLASEIRFLNFQEESGSRVPGVSFTGLKEYPKFNCADALETLERPVDFRAPLKNPLEYMDDWLDVSKTQSSPQEQDNGQYKVNVVKYDDVGKQFGFKLFV